MVLIVRGRAYILTLGAYTCGCLSRTLIRRLHDHLLADLDHTQGKLDPKKLQLQLTGFLEKSTGMFMEELWGLLVDAQSSLGGIPSAFLQDKKQEMIQAKVRADFFFMRFLRRSNTHA